MDETVRVLMEDGDFTETEAEALVEDLFAGVDADILASALSQPSPTVVTYPRHRYESVARAAADVNAAFEDGVDAGIFVDESYGAVAIII